MIEKATRYVRPMLTAALLGSLLCHGCTLGQGIQSRNVAGLGYFEYREAAAAMEGIVVAAPHGAIDPQSGRFAAKFSERTGAGLVIAYGFKARRLAVTQPIVRSRPQALSLGTPLERGSIFSEYREILTQGAKGKVKFYVGIYTSRVRDKTRAVEVASSGLTFEEAAALKLSFMQIRDRRIGKRPIERIPVAVEPADNIAWRLSGIKHHGILMVAEKGLNVRIPREFPSKEEEDLYGEILSLWLRQSIRFLGKKLLGLPRIDVQTMDLGRLELIRSRKPRTGIVIGSPHGTFDEHTAELVKRLSYRTGLAAVIAKGFSPTQAGGWRINVNRPTEKIFRATPLELPTERARNVYEAFKNLVLRGAQGQLDLYIDFHQYTTDERIQVATVGISPREAVVVKEIYQNLRNLTLRHYPGVYSADMIIEPLDTVEIGASATKAEGIMSVAKKSLHMELPFHRVLSSAESREAYTRILGDLLKVIGAFLPAGSDDYWNREQ